MAKLPRDPADHVPECDCLACQTIELAFREVCVVEKLVAVIIDDLQQSYRVPAGAMEYALMALAFKSFAARGFTADKARELIDHVFQIAYSKGEN